MLVGLEKIPGQAPEGTTEEPQDGMVSTIVSFAPPNAPRHQKHAGATCLIRF